MVSSKSEVQSSKSDATRNSGRGTRNAFIRRALLSVGAIGLVLAVAVYQGGAIIGRSDSAYRVESGRPVVEPVSGSVFVRSYPVVWNGDRAEFTQYTSTLSAGDVIREYGRRLPAQPPAARSDRSDKSDPSDRSDPSDSSAPTRPCAQAPMLSATGAGCATLAYVTADQKAVGVVAFDNAGSRGSSYFVGVMRAQPLQAPADGDCAGREPPGVPRPGRTTRTLCIENLGGIPSVLVFYDAWGRPGEILDDLRRDMTRQGWLERGASSTLLTRNYEGNGLAVFARGREQCIVAVDQEPKSGKIILMVFWAERAWLPDGTAL